MKLLGGFLAGALVVFAFGLLMSLPVMWLWNWLIPEIFRLPAITWLQAWGLLMLAGFLVKPSSKNKS